MKLTLPGGDTRHEARIRDLRPELPSPSAVLLRRLSESPVGNYLPALGHGPLIVSVPYPAR